MSAREDLAALIEANRTEVKHWVDDSQDPPEHGSSLALRTGEEIADAIIAAGWVSPADAYRLQELAAFWENKTIEATGNPRPILQPWQCGGCGHLHTGDSWGRICPGCPCETRR